MIEGIQYSEQIVGFQYQRIAVLQKAGCESSPFVKLGLFRYIFYGFLNGSHGKRMFIAITMKGNLL